MKFFFYTAAAIVCLASCNNKTQDKTLAKADITTEKDTLILSKKFNDNIVVGDFDGDTQKDSAFLMLNPQNNLHAIKIKYHSGNTDILGGGNSIVGNKKFTDAGLGIFKIAPKDHIYFNNVGVDGDILREEDVKDEDKIKLPNDGIFLHYKESCGGGIIYNENGTYKWIIQE